MESLGFSVHKIMTSKNSVRDFPGGPVVKNLPSNARDAGSIPGWGTKIPHTVRQLSLRAATTTEPAHSGARASQLGRSPHTATREKARVSQRKILYATTKILHASTKT